MRPADGADLGKRKIKNGKVKPGKREKCKNRPTVNRELSHTTKQRGGNSHREENIRGQRSHTELIGIHCLAQGHFSVR